LNHYKEFRKLTPSWHLYADTGGTFTDALALSSTGEWRRAKVLSSGALRGSVRKLKSDNRIEADIPWKAEADLLKGGKFRLLRGDGSTCKVISFDPVRSIIELDSHPGPEVKSGAAFEVVIGEEAPILAARLLIGAPAGAELSNVSMRLGSTLATNALLTRSGAPTALFITSGFKDLLQIGDQQRPDLFALNVKKPAPLYQSVVEVDERLYADGKVLAPLDTKSLEKIVTKLLDEGIRSAAVALLHSDRNPDHEKALSAFLKKKGFDHISCSSYLSPAIRILPRASTAVVNALLAPIVENYLHKIEGALSKNRLLTMTSAGGLLNSKTVQPKDMLLSGPAGGVVGAAKAGRASGFDRIISFDMGGTSTDVARFDKDYDYVFEHSVGHARLLAPALSIETVAAGGGSICSYQRGGLFVGPKSAGASPGPASYGVGGPLTLTDVNLLLGRLDDNRFGVPLDLGQAEEKLVELMERLEKESSETASKEDLLEGFLAIANERMADAIKEISIRRGYDPEEYALVAFGGAGGQHACEVADRLGVKTVVIPEDAGLLSACGMAAALVERFAEQQILKPLSQVEKKVPEYLKVLENKAIEALLIQGIERKDSVIRRRIAQIRFEGQETALQIEVNAKMSLRDAFEAKYQAVYGHQPGDREAELVSLRAIASSTPPPEERWRDEPASFEATPEGSRNAWFQGKSYTIPVYSRDKLKPGAALNGPSLVFETHSSTVVSPGWRLNMDNARALVMTISETSKCEVARPEAVQVELFSHRFEAIAGEMGEALRRTAVSTNVKERLDFSCALLDSKGELVVNAPHIPVHLGAMGLCIRSVRKKLNLTPGDMAVTNHPAFGGSHLPDITVIAPVHTADKTLLGYVAARAHHAEIGGVTPGSMPPAATRLSDEGIVIPPTIMIRNNTARWEEIEKILTDGPWPSRAVGDNLADIKAAAAACHQGSARLVSLAEEYGRKKISHYMDALKDRAEQRMRAAIKEIPDGVFEAEEKLDDGAPLKVKIKIASDRADIDFTGSSGIHRGNLNATLAIVQSAVIYILRLLVAEDLPLNEGLMKPVTLNLPEGLLNPPFPDDPSKAPSIVGGNVETSQRLVDTLIKALGISAASQGTMNNVLFGDDRFSYYETVCGGCGAGPGFDGQSAVHSHMTNTRITDPEIIEYRFPVLLKRFGIRRGSGGKGANTGGDGVVRELLFLRTLELSILSQRRNEGPFGMSGGGSGLPGEQHIIRADGSTVALKPIDSITVNEGDRLILKTPGGGAYGKS